MTEEFNESRPRTTVQLLHGITWKESIYKEVTIWEMQDQEEKILGSKNPDMAAIICNCICMLGKEQPTKPDLRRDIIPNMQLGDWSRILLSLRRLSLEDKYKYKSKCPECKKISKFTIDLSTIEYIYALEPGDRYEYETREGKIAVFRPVYVKDRDALAEIGADEKDALKRSLALRLVSLGGDDVSVPGDSWRKHTAQAVKLMKKHGLVSMRETEAIRTWLKKEKHTETEGEDGEITIMRKALDAKADSILEDTCPVSSCGTQWSHYMEIDPSFLLPSLAE